MSPHKVGYLKTIRKTKTNSKQNSKKVGLGEPRTGRLKNESKTDSKKNKKNQKKIKKIAKKNAPAANCSKIKQNCRFSPIFVLIPSFCSNCVAFCCSLLQARFFWDFFFYFFCFFESVFDFFFLSCLVFFVFGWVCFFFCLSCLFKVDCFSESVFESVCDRLLFFLFFWQNQRCVAVAFS